MQKMILMLLLTFVIYISVSAVNVTKRLPPLYVGEDTEIMLDDELVTLRAGTPVVVEAIRTYSSKELSAGQTISVRVKYNVIQKRKTLVAAGALGSAIVSSIEQPRSFGRAGKIELQIQSVQAVDGQQVLLSGIPILFEGESKKALAWGVAIPVAIFTYGLGLLLGFAFKGKAAEVRAGTTMNGAVASDIDIDMSEAN